MLCVLSQDYDYNSLYIFNLIEYKNDMGFNLGSHIQLLFYSKTHFFMW